TNVVDGAGKTMTFAPVPITTLRSRPSARPLICINVSAGEASTIQHNRCWEPTDTPSRFRVARFLRYLKLSVVSQEGRGVDHANQTTGHGFGTRHRDCFRPRRSFPPGREPRARPTD